MSTLVIQLPARPRLQGGAEGVHASAQGRAPAELFYVLTPDGLAVAQHGRAVAALLPKADSVVLVLADTDVSWHRIKVPKAPAARQRAAIAGVLEEQLLDEPAAMHLALAPDAVGGQTAWVAAIDKAWFAGELRTLEKAGVQVERAVPVSWPEDTPLAHFSAPFGADPGSAMQLTWSDAEGVAAIGLQGALARQMLPLWTARPARWSAHPSVAAPAERWLGHSVVVLSDEQRLLQAIRSLWNLRQFDLAPRHRGMLAMRDAWRRFRSASWRPVRYGLVALVALQVLGLNLWAWHQQRQIDGKRAAMVQLIRTTHPQVRAVLDAPVQMQRETDALRSAAGKSGDADLETMLGAVAAAWPDGQAPLATLKFDNGRLSFAAGGWPEAQIAQLRAQLAGGGWDLAENNGVLSVSRAAKGSS
ncbi:MAG: type II secretion system protein GspL [Pseudomonadota bacterium]